MKKLLLLLFLAACQSPEPLDPPEPLAPSTPEARGVPSSAILSFIEALETQLPDALHSLMILRYGRTIAAGWWSPYQAETPHWLYSLSKSFTSTAVGLAIEEGLLSLDDPVISFFPEKLPAEVGYNLENMRIRDLLTMNTGQQKDGSGKFRRESEDWVKSFLALPVEHKPGTKFTYNSGASYMLSAIIHKKTGKNLVEYLQARLFDPLGIDPPSWQTDPKGISTGGWGLNLKTEDIAKFGQVYLQRGKWEGEQIVPADWVEQATSFQVSNGSNPESDWDQGYGFQFWRCRHHAYRGDGAFGQFCVVLPDQEAVVVMTAGTYDLQGLLNLVWEHLLPAMEDQPLPENPTARKELEQKLQKLALSGVEGEEYAAMAESISGSIYRMEENPLKIQTLQFDLAGPEKRLTLQNEKGTFQLPIGYRSMARGKIWYFYYGKFGELQTAATGAWISERTYRAKVYFTETPHSITYDFTFDKNAVKVDGKYGMPFGEPKELSFYGRL